MANTSAKQQQKEISERAAQQAASANNSLSALARLFGGGHEAPARSNAEAMGRGFRKYVLPLLMQGFNSWKRRYDARGDFNARAESILNTIDTNGLEALNVSDRNLYEFIQRIAPEKIEEHRAKHPKPPEPAPTPAETQQQPAPQPTQQPQTTQNPGLNAAFNQSLAPYVGKATDNNQDSQTFDFRNLTDEMIGAKSGPFGGANLNLGNLIGQDQLAQIVDDIRKRGGW